MATQAFTTLLQDVVLHAPGCSEPLALHALRLSSVEFCEKSLLWTELQDAVSVDASSFPYTLTPTDTNARVIRVEEVFFDSARLVATPVAELRHTTDDWRDDTGTPREYVVEGVDSLTLLPIPDTTGDLVIKLILAPTLTASGMDEGVLNRYREGIIAGALARLVAVPAQPYSNPAAVGMYGSVFSETLHRARINANTGYTRAELRVASRKFA